MCIHAGPGDYSAQQLGVLIPDPPHQEGGRLLVVLHRLPRTKRHHHQGRFPHPVVDELLDELTVPDSSPSSIFDPATIRSV
jgi:hypothetical protein